MQEEPAVPPEATAAAGAARPSTPASPPCGPEPTTSPAAPAAPTSPATPSAAPGSAAAFTDEDGEPFDAEEFFNPYSGPPEGDDAWLAQVASPVADAWLEARQPPSDGPEALAAGFTHRDHVPGARGFAAGGPLDTMEPGPVLAGFADDSVDAGLASLSDDELVGVLGAARRLASRAAGIELAAVAGLEARRAADARAMNDWRQHEHVADEIAVALTLTCRAADKLLDLATGITRLPAVTAALAAGRIDLSKASVYHYELAALGDVPAAAIAAVTITDAAGLTTGQLRDVLHRAVLAHDPEAARKRREKAQKDARVECWPENRGTAALAGRDLPPADVLAADKHIDALARELKKAGTPGTLEQLRARVFLALLTSQPLYTLLPGNDGSDAQDTDPQGGAGHRAGLGPAGRPDGHGHGGRPGAGGSELPGRDSRDQDGANDGPSDGDQDDRPGDGDQDDRPGGGDQDDRPGDGNQDDRPGDGNQDDRPGDGNQDDRPGGGDDGGDDAGWGNGGGTRRPGPGPGPSGGWPGPGRGLAFPAGLTGSVNLTVPLSTWLGLTAQPGEAAGHGPLDAATSHDLVSRLARQPGNHWCLTVTSPDGRAIGHGCACTGPPGTTGPPGQRAGPGSDPYVWLAGVKIRWLETGACGHARETRAYQPSPGLRHLIKTRDRTCSFPGCRRAARRCDDDHTIPHDQGGRTCECNLAPLCRRHHAAKQAPGWHLQQTAPGDLTWTLPGGRTRTITPRPYPR